MRWTKIRWNIIAEESKKRHTDNWEWDQSTLGWDKKCFTDTLLSKKKKCKIKDKW